MRDISFNRFGKFLLIPIALLVDGLFNITNAQKFNLGTDFVNRFVWRSFDYGNSSSIQPYMEFSSVEFSVGSWASYAISPVNNDGANALDATAHHIYITYTFNVISLGKIDYYAPLLTIFLNPYMEQSI